MAASPPDRAEQGSFTDFGLWRDGRAIPVGLRLLRVERPRALLSQNPCLNASAFSMLSGRLPACPPPLSGRAKPGTPSRFFAEPQVMNKVRINDDEVKRLSDFNLVFTVGFSCPLTATVKSCGQFRTGI